MNQENDSLRKAKNIIRGMFNRSNTYLEQRNLRPKLGKSITDLIYEGLHDLSPRSEKLFFQWMSGYAGTVVPLIPTVPIRKWDGLKIPTVQFDVPLYERVRLTAHFLARRTEELRAFVCQRELLQTALFSGDFANATKALDSIEDAHGFSLWLLETRIAVLQRAQGLEAQKSYARNISRSAQGKLAGVVAFYCSERNEEGTVLGRYRSRTQQRIEKWPLKEDLRHVFEVLLHVRTSDAVSQKDRSKILAVLTEVSLLDAYDGLFDAIETLVSTALEVDSDQIRALLAALRKLPREDPRVGNVLAFIQPTLARIPLRDGAVDSGSLINRATELAISAQSPLFAGSSAAIEHSLIEAAEATLSRRDGFTEIAEVGNKLFDTFSNLPAVRGVGAFIAFQQQFKVLSGPSVGTGLLLNSCEKTPFDSQVGGSCTASFSELIAGTIFETEVQARRLVSEGRLCEALDVLREIDNSDPLARRRLSPLLVAVAIQLDDLPLAIDMAAAICATTPELARILPLEALASQLRDEIPARISPLSAAVVLDAEMNRSGDESLFQPLQFAFSEALTQLGVERPSEIIVAASEADDRRAIIVYYLHQVAQPTILDVCFWIYKRTRDTLEERIKVCSLLMELDPTHAATYSAEIRDITTVINIEDGVQQVDRSRVFVNLDKLHKWAEAELEEGLNRYRGLKVSGPPSLSKEVDRLLKEFISGDAAGIAVLYPEDEASALLVELFQTVADQYFNDTDFGLDAYLSMRVRHGSFAGHLRGPFEEVGLLATKDKDTGEYRVHKSDVQPQNAWSGEQSAANACIVSFSKAFDELIERVVKERLQISSKAHPDGFFRVNIIPFVIFYLRGKLDAETGLDHFLTHTLELLQINLSACLKKARDYLLKDVQDGVAKAVEAFNVEVEEKLSIAPCRALREKMISALPDWHASLERVADWFAPDVASDMQVQRSMEQIVDIALQATKNARRNFSPIIHREIEDLGPQDTIHLVDTTDILFTALDNVYVHSGLGDSPEVTIRITGEPTPSAAQWKVTFCVENRIAPTVKCPAAERKLQRLRSMIDSGDYRSKVKLEGGTGIPKLKRLIASDNRQTLQFGFGADDTFRVEVSMVFVRRSQ